MSKTDQAFNFFYPKLLSETTKEKVETIIVSVPIISFILHLLLIALVDLNVLQFNDFEIVEQSDSGDLYAVLFYFNLRSLSSGILPAEIYLDLHRETV